MSKISKIIVLAIAVGFSSWWSQSLSAQECVNLNGVKDPTDGDLYFYDKSASQWKPVSLFSALDIPLNEKSKFIYVVQDDSDKPRSGVVVIKSGRNLNSLEVEPSAKVKQVRLRRPTQPFSNEKCGRVEAFPKTAVSSESYDAYHDKNYEGPGPLREYGVLRSFHFKYLGRDNRCQQTDDNTSESPLRGLIQLFSAPETTQFRSRLSQFSYNRFVVYEGYYSRYVDILRTGSLLSKYIPGSKGLIDQRVQSMRYKLSNQKLACIPFHLKVTGPDFFVRINDLEGQNLLDGRIIRGPEREWYLNR